MNEWIKVRVPPKLIKFHIAIVAFFKYTTYFIWINILYLSGIFYFKWLHSLLSRYVGVTIPSIILYSGVKCGICSTMHNMTPGQFYHPGGTSSLTESIVPQI